MSHAWIKSASLLEYGRDVYAVEDQQAAEVVHLCKTSLTSNGCLIVRRCNDLRVEFALLEFEMGPVSGDDASRTLYRMVMHGEGPSGSLRECRHTWWGEADNAGYIFYPNFDLITAGLNALKKWFDGAA